MDTELVRKFIDTGTGALYPHFDENTGLLFLSAKGDGNIRYYEVDPQNDEIHFIDQLHSTTPTRAFDFLPKTANDFHRCVIMKGVKLESNAAQFISFRVPRKSDQFQEDIFPPIRSEEAALTADSWFEGKTENPRLMDVKPLFDGTYESKAVDMPPVRSMQSLIQENEFLKLELSDCQKELQIAQVLLNEKDIQLARLRENLSNPSESPERPRRVSSVHV
jgi:coronin-1B/1C/6